MATNQFAPRVGASQLGNAPLISVAALAGVPEFVRGAFGERVLRKARQAAMLDFELIEDSDCFIPQLTMTTFTHTVARMAGEEHLGLKLAPYLTVASYGSWGEYLLGARTLGSAIRRAAATMEFHARGDALSLDLIDGCARISYVSAARGLDGYVHVAWGTIGAILSLCKAYLPRFGVHIASRSMLQRRADRRSSRTRSNAPSPSARRSLQCGWMPVPFARLLIERAARCSR